MASSVAVTKTNNQDIDGTLEGVKWDALTLTFSFPTSKDFYGPNGDGTGYSAENEPLNNFAALNATQKSAARAAISFYEAITNLDFTEQTESLTQHADFRLAMSDKPGTAWGIYPGPEAAAGDSWYRKAGGAYDNPVLGNYAWYTFFHELGHNLGLKHGHEAGGVANTKLTAAHDSHEYSIMTYHAYVGTSSLNVTEEDWGCPQTPMMYDIAALQHMYGANFNHNSGNTTYRWNSNNGQMSINGVGQGIPGGGAANSNRILMTLWDGNGTDTYDLSNYRTDLKISLLPGGWSTFSAAQLADLGAKEGVPNAVGAHMAIGNVANALLYKGDTRSLIENASGGAGNDRIIGNQAVNKLVGGRGDDYLAGGLRDDTLTGGDGDDSLIGGDHTDTAVFAYAFSQYAVVRNLNGSVVVEHLSGSEGTDTLLSVEFARFGGVLINLATFTAQTGGTGNDTINGKYYRSDHLRGGAGNDTLLGDVFFPSEPPYEGPQNDVLLGEAGNDILDGIDGSDTLDGGPNNDTLRSWFSDKPEPDRLLGGSGTDLAIVNRGNLNVPIIVNFANPAVAKRLPDGTTVKDVERFEFYGGNGNDRITGGVLADKLFGGSGDDVVNGGAGADWLAGGSGDDWLYVNVSGTFDGSLLIGGDYVVEGDNGGNDRVLTSVSYRLEFGKEVETLSTDNPAGTAPIRLTGNEYDQAIVGNAGNNVIDGNPRNEIFDGQQGFDIMNGLGGNDIYHVRQARDEVNEAARKGIDAIVVHLYTEAPGYVLKPMSEVEKISIAEQQFGNRFNLTGSNFNNTISGTNGINILNGLGGNDVLNGLDGNDTLLGGDGRDVIAGGMGTDTMTGAAGVDRFDFNSTLETRRGSLRDVITDFVHLVDDIDLSTINPGTASGAFAFLNAKGAQFTGAKGVVRWFQENPAGTANDRTIVEGDLDGDRFADFQIQINGLKTLTAADFFL